MQGRREMWEPGSPKGETGQDVCTQSLTDQVDFKNAFFLFPCSSLAAAGSLGVGVFPGLGQRPASPMPEATGFYQGPGLWGICPLPKEQ